MNIEGAKYSDSSVIKSKLHENRKMMKYKRQLGKTEVKMEGVYKYPGDIQVNICLYDSKFNVFHIIQFFP